MPIPKEAQDIIAQAIYRNSVMASLFLKKDQLALIVSAIEHDLENAGYVVMTRDALRDEYDEADEADFEDGQ